MAQDLTNYGLPQNFDNDPYGLGVGQTSQPATAGSTARTASGFSGGFAVRTYQDGTDYIDADRFELEHPFLVFFKGIKQVALRSIESVKSIDVR